MSPLYFLVKYKAGVEVCRFPLEDKYRGGQSFDEFSLRLKKEGCKMLACLNPLGFNAMGERGAYDLLVPLPITIGGVARIKNLPQEIPLNAGFQHGGYYYGFDIIL